SEDHRKISHNSQNFHLPAFGQFAPQVRENALYRETRLLRRVHDVFAPTMAGLLDDECGCLGNPLEKRNATNACGSGAPAGAGGCVTSTGDVAGVSGPNRVAGAKIFGAFSLVAS